MAGDFRAGYSPGHLLVVHRVEALRGRGLGRQQVAEGETRATLAAKSNFVPASTFIKQFSNIFRLLPGSCIPSPRILLNPRHSEQFVAFGLWPGFSISCFLVQPSVSCHRLDLMKFCGASWSSASRFYSCISPLNFLLAACA